MMRSLRGFSRTLLLQRKGRTFLTGAGIALGVALFFGALIANASALDGMDRAIEDAAGRVDVVITPIGDTRQAVMSGAIGEKTSALPDVTSVAGIIAVSTTISTPEGRSLGLELNDRSPVVLVGADSAEVERLYTFRFAAGRQVSPGANEIVLTQRLADELSLQTGGRATVATPAGNRRVVVAGILEDSGAARFNQGNVAFTSLEWARGTIGLTGTVSQVLVDLDEGVDADRWMRLHGSKLGRGVNVRNFGDGPSLGIARRQLAAFAGSLNLLSATVVFIAGFLIYLTLSTSVVERVRMYGTLRALGARQTQVRRLIVTEALLLGGVATAVGLLLGLGIANGLVRLSRGLVELEATRFIVPAWAAIAAVALGIVTTLASAFMPARRAARLDPIEAMRGDFATQVRLSRTWIAGSVALVVGSAVLYAGTKVAYLGVAAPMMLFGAVAVVPLLLRPIARVTGALTSRLARGVGDVAVLHLAKERTRSGYTLALVMIVMAAVFAISGTNDSFTRSFDEQIVREFGADLRIGAASTFPPAFERELAAIDGVESMSPMALANTHLVREDGKQEDVLARFYDPQKYFASNDLLWRTGDPAAAKKALADGSGLVLMHASAERLGLGPGDDVVLRTMKGNRSFRIAATAEIANVIPTLDLSWRNGERFFGIRRPSSFAVTVDEGADVNAVRKAIEDGPGSRTTLFVSTLADVRANIREQINGGLAAFVVLLMMAGILGFFGLANTMAVSMLERYREIGLLRAIGTRKRQVRRMALVESSTLVAVALVLSVPLGTFLSVAFVRLGGRLLGDVTLHYSFPWKVLPLLVIGGVIAAAATAIGPARRATQLDIETALRFE